MRARRFNLVSATQVAGCRYQRVRYLSEMNEWQSRPQSTVLLQSRYEPGRDRCASARAGFDSEFGRVLPVGRGRVASRRRTQSPPPDALGATRRAPEPKTAARADDATRGASVGGATLGEGTPPTRPHTTRKPLENPRLRTGLRKHTLNAPRPRSRPTRRPGPGSAFSPPIPTVRPPARNI